MPWTDRLKEAAYTSPSGTRLVFLYEDVSRIVSKKTSGFNFPDADGTFVQDLGHTGRRYPLRVIFAGADYDLQAEVFEGLLLERGTGVLEHPLYGPVDVVPFGDIKRTDRLKTAANQAVIEVTFWATIGLIYPSSQADPASAVLAAVEEYNTAAAAALAETTDLDNTVDAATFRGDYLALLDGASSGLQGIADTQDDVLQQFEAINDSINQGIDVLIADPLTLAFQTAILIQTPARAITAIGARLEAYRALSAGIFAGAPAEPGNDPRPVNRFRAQDLYGATYVTGAVVSVVNTQFEIRTDALSAADLLLAQLEAATVWRDDNFSSLNVIDTGEAYQQLQEAVALAAGFLVQISFSLKQERRLVLTSARTMIDLAAELYGSVDDQLDFFIETNGLTGSEILELPRGREIVYYV